MANALKSLLPDPRLTVIEADFLKTDLNELHALLGGGGVHSRGQSPLLHHHAVRAQASFLRPAYAGAFVHAAAGGRRSAFLRARAIVFTAR